MSESHMTEHQRSQNQVTENQIPEPPKAGLIALHTSVGSEADALALAKMALEAKRAACVQIDTIQSLYPWDGSIQHETEWRILFKTSQSNASALWTLVQDHHPYELPAIYSLEVRQVSEAYLQWVETMTAT